MKNLNYLNEFRVSIFKDGDIGDESNGAFIININEDAYMIIASNGLDWEHVSVSNKSKIPSWAVMSTIKEMFFEDEEVVMQLHPAKSNYINIHNNCLHLWRPIKNEIPTPPNFMV